MGVYVCVLKDRYLTYIDIIQYASVTNPKGTDNKRHNSTTKWLQ